MMASAAACAAIQPSQSIVFLFLAIHMAGMRRALLADAKQPTLRCASDHIGV
jgi:hypothetical protein